MMTLGHAPALAVLFCVLVLTTSTETIAQQYTVVPLDPLPEFYEGSASDINNVGQVVGRSFSDFFHGSDGRPVLYEDGAPLDLGSLGGEPSGASAINDAGQIVGYSALVDGDLFNTHAFLWEDGVMIDLNDVTPLPPDWLLRGAVDINNSGQVIGSLLASDNSDTYWWGYLLETRPQYKVTPIGTLGGDSVFVRRINDWRQVVGKRKTSGLAYHAFLWQDSLMTDLGTLTGFGHSEADDLNNRSQIVGIAYNSRNSRSGGIVYSRTRAFLWEGGTMIDLGGGENGLADGINDLGHIVGRARFEDGEVQAALWRNGQIINLNDRIPADADRFLFRAKAINNAGQIICSRCVLIPISADLDADGVDDAVDNCLGISNPDQVDLDGDGIGDLCDNCSLMANLAQQDVDDDGLGNACDDDDDDDGIVDLADSCPVHPNREQLDADGDGVGDICDRCPGFDDGLDSDIDGVPDGCDNCPEIENDGQPDADGDGIGDVCDPDEDADGVLFEDDNCPSEPNSDQADSDRDGKGDVCDYTHNPQEAESPAPCGLVLFSALPILLLGLVCLKMHNRCGAMRVCNPHQQIIT